MNFQREGLHQKGELVEIGNKDRGSIKELDATFMDGPLDPRLNFFSEKQFKNTVFLL